MLVFPAADYIIQTDIIEYYSIHRKYVYLFIHIYNSLFITIVLTFDVLISS